MTFLVSIKTPNILDYLNLYGSIPLPHYIRGGVADEKDREDYQTTYAKEAGSLAAPTAGLHFSQKVFAELAQKKIHQSYLTLHVGLGTFSPIRSENILEHKMHEEYFNLDDETVKTLNEQKKNLIAVGTTTLRALESSFENNEFQKRPTGSKTNIFLHPGKEIKSITGLITNFHLPESSLLILVSALLGREKTLEIYHNAIEHKYRFFSYGDAMFIRRKISE